MKKIFLGVATALMAIGGFSCNGGGSASLSTNADSTAYAQGMMQGKQLAQAIKTEIENGNKIDVDQFLKGFETALNDTTKRDYAIGLNMGDQTGRMLSSDSLSIKAFFSAFKAAIKGDSTTKYSMTDSIAEELMRNYQVIKQEKMMKQHEAEIEKQFGENKKKGADYIANFKKEEGVKTTASGIAYKVLIPGTGAMPKASDRVKVKYVGTTVDGKEFDSNSEGIEFGLDGVIKGWTEVLQLMKVGEKVKVAIPYELAYGAQGNSGIDPFSTLVFEIELLEIVK